MWSLVESFEFKRLFNLATVNWIVGIWFATCLITTLVLRASPNGSPAYYGLVSHGIGASVVACAFSIPAHHNYDHSFAASASMVIGYALVSMVDAVWYAVGELNQCSDLYDDQDAISSIQKAYTDMVNSGMTQVNVQSLQRFLSTYDITPYDEYMCIGIKHGKKERIAYTFFLVLVIIVTFVCGVALIWIFERQSPLMKKAGSEIGSVISSTVAKMRGEMEEFRESRRHEKRN